MSTTNQQVLDGIYNILNEASNSEAAQYDSNNASSPTYTSTAGLILVANNFAGRMCKSFYGWQDTGTLTYATGALYTPLSGLTTALGSTIWRALSVIWNGIPLTQTDYAHARINFPTLLSDANATPQFFYQDGQFNLCIAPKPSAGDTLEVVGYASPPPITSGNLTSNVAWIQDDDIAVWVYGCAAEIARKNSEDLILSGKVALWDNEWLAGWQRLYKRLDPAHARAYFNVPSPIEAEQGRQTQ